MYQQITDNIYEHKPQEDQKANQFSTSFSTHTYKISV